MKCIPVICFALLVLASCEKRESNCGYTETTHVYYNINNDLKSKMPYRGGTDTLVFKSNSGDLDTVCGQGRKTTDNVKVSSVTTADCGGTPKVTYHYETEEITFTGTGSSINSIQHTASKDFDPANFTGLTIRVNTDIAVYNGVEYVVNSLPVEDSVVISGAYIEGGYLDDAKTFLYSTQFGILRFLESSGKIWTRVK